VPRLALGTRANPLPPPPARLVTNSEPELYLTRISVNVYLRSHEVADPSLSAALLMFRRAANVIARVEDSLILYGRRSTAIVPIVSSRLNGFVGGLPQVFEITQDTHNVAGLYPLLMGPTQVGDVPALARNRVALPLPLRAPYRANVNRRGGSLGDGVVNTIVAAINRIENDGYGAPFACLLGTTLFEAICTPAATLVLPRDRVLPFLQGPLLRSSELAANSGLVISLGGAPVELVMASDVHVRFLQQTLEGRLAFRVSERVAVRIKDPGAVQWISR
jgi:uncharacterized linocin/CFP29 family protein